MTNTFIVDKIFNKCQTFSGTHFPFMQYDKLTFDARFLGILCYICPCTIGYSVSDHTLVLKSIINLYLYKHKKIYCAFFDYQVT